MDKPEGGFPAGAKLGADSNRESMNWEPHGPSPPMGVLSPWAGHPSDCLHGPSGTSLDVSPPQRGHVSTPCLSNLRKVPESSLWLIIAYAGDVSAQQAQLAAWGLAQPRQRGLLWAAAPWAALLGLKHLGFGFVGLVHMGRVA